MTNYVRSKVALTMRNAHNVSQPMISLYPGKLVRSDNSYVVDEPDYFEPVSDDEAEAELRAAQEKDERRSQVMELATRTGQHSTESAAAVGTVARDVKPKVEQIARKDMGARATIREAANSWASRAAAVIDHNRTETRALTAASIDIPQLVPVDVVPKARPERLIDLLVNRQSLTGNNFEFLQQTTRTNNADVVADSAEKPTSVFTITPVEDRVRVVAHLSEMVPVRIFADHNNVERFLRVEMAEGVLDALEDQVLTGDGLTENMTGILNTTGITSVAFATDVLTTLRKTRTALQNIGERPTAWVLSTADAEALDLQRESTEGGFLLGGPENIFGDIPIIVNPSLAAGQAILADWEQARLYVREDVRIDVDLASGFSTNEVRLRAEGRFNIGVLRPAAFAVADLTA